MYFFYDLLCKIVGELGFIHLNDRIVRAPVPWHEDYRELKDYNTNHLFITNPIMLELQNIWFDQ